jgi:hypothetical protein
MTDYERSPLPVTATDLCKRCHAPTALIRHLEIVHHAATQLLKGLVADFPGLCIDAESVLFGAATHDLGKVVHPSEIYGAGHQHEQSGPGLLISLAVPVQLARFARTHGQWDSCENLEDLFVALADHVWKGCRDERLESRTAAVISQQTGQTQWEAFMLLDDLLTTIASRSVERLGHSITRPFSLTTQQGLLVNAACSEPLSESTRVPRSEQVLPGHCPSLPGSDGP